MQHIIHYFVYVFGVPGVNRIFTIKSKTSLLGQ